MNYRREEILNLLLEDKEKIFKIATSTREEHCNGISLRAVIEFSNYCINNCIYCGMRRDNVNLSRYRMSGEEIVDAAREVKNKNISTIFLQSGCDPASDYILCKAIERIKKELGLKVILGIGERSFEEYKRIRDAGGDGFILKHETSDGELFKKMKFYSLEDRLRCLRDLKKLNFEVGTGCIVGLPGQKFSSFADDILLGKLLECEMISASAFIPHDQTPLSCFPQGSLELTLRVMAVMRIILPHASIPATSTLERLARGGQFLGLKAGANILTINATPEKYRDNYVIYSSDRKLIDLEHVRSILEKYEE